MKDRRTLKHRVFLISAGIAVVAAPIVVAIVVLRGPSLVGIWINETPVFEGQYGAAPGRLRIQVNSDGTGLLLTDRHWIYKGFEYRVVRSHVLVRLDYPMNGKARENSVLSTDFQMAAYH